MKFLIAVALIALAANAKEIGKCQVTHWGEWSECYPSQLCQSDIPDVEYYTYPLPAAKYDDGRANMDILKTMKAKHWKEVDECIADGTCPEAVPPKRMSFAECENGMASIYPCRNIDILSFLNFQDMGFVSPAPGANSPRGNDIWGWTDPANNDEYAIMGVNGGTAFVRITDPTNPEPLAFMYSRGAASTWRDMKVIDNTVYIVSEAANHGLQVYDLFQLRGMQPTSPVPLIEPTTTYSLFGNAHNIVSNEESKFLYVVGATRGDFPHCSGGLHVIDVSDRLNPQFVGCFAQDGYVHDAECVMYHGPDTRYQGREVCFCYNEDTFTIVDVQDKTNMTMISKTGYTGYAYTHQGWLTENHEIALLDDELDESRNTDKRTRTYIWDVRNLRVPELRRTFFSSQEAIDHNQYIKGEFTYQANYRAGLRILHIDEANYNLNEVAYLDTYPANTIAQFDGAWSNYPYFKSGVVVVASIDFGLFVTMPDYEAMEREKNQIHSERTRTRRVVSCAKGVETPAMEQHASCSDPVC